MLTESSYNFSPGDTPVAWDGVTVMAPRCSLWSVFFFHDGFSLSVKKNVADLHALPDAPIFYRQSPGKAGSGWVPAAAICCCPTLPKMSLGVEEMVSVSDVGESGTTEN